MKKNFKRVLSLILATCFIISASLCTTIFAADETIIEKALDCFDGTWNDWTATDAANNQINCTLPSGISSLYYNNLSVSKAAKVSGQNGKSAEDASLKLYTSGGGKSREFGANLFECTGAANAPDNIESKDKFVVYVDLSVDSIPTSVGYFGMRILGKQDTNTSKNNYRDIFSISNKDATTHTLTVGSSSADFAAGDWISLAVEFEYVNENAVKAIVYMNGVLLGEKSEQSLSGLSFVRLGFQTAAVSTATAPVMYIDNVAFYKGGFSEAQYKAIEDASALSVSDIIGDNTDLDNIATNLTLPEVGSNGSTITWASSKENVVSNKGVVTPSATEDTTVTLTATVTSGEASETKAYTVTVPKNELITFDDIKGKNLYEGSIVSNFVLPQKLSNETPIVWESSNANIIAADGKVTRYNDASHRVTLTAKKASDGSVVKTFELYVIGDDIVNDDASSFDKVYSQGYNTQIRTDEAFREVGFGLINTGADSYIIYDAAPGAIVSVEYATNVTGTTKRNCNLWTSEDGVTYSSKAFAAFETAIDDNAEYYEFGKADSWKKNVFTTTEVLPAGTRYLKVRSGHLKDSYINSIKITSNTPEDITFDDVKGENIAADKIMSDLDLSYASITSITSSHSDIIDNTGKVNRPQKDTVVTLTMTINNDMVEATKIFNLTVLGTNEEIKSEKPWIFYNDGSGIKRINISNLANAGTIEFDADVTYYGEAAGKKAIGIVAVYKGSELIEVKTVTFELASKSEAQRVSTVLTLSKESSEYEGAKVCGFIWEDGTIRNLGEAVSYKAK